MIVTDRYIVNEDFQPKGEYGEIAVSKGQTVEILGRPPGSRSWRVRIMDCDVTGDTEGLVPYSFLRKMEEAPLRNKRSSVETLHSQSSEGKNIILLTFCNQKFLSILVCYSEMFLYKFPNL